MEAAEAYLGPGNFKKAYQSSRACLKIDEGRRDAELLVTKAKKLLESQTPEAKTLKKGETKGRGGRKTFAMF